MGARERRKGARAQTEAANAVTEALGLLCRNGAANGVKSGDDLVTPGLDVRWEVKRHESPAIGPYLRQVQRDKHGTEPGVVLWRANRMGWVAMMTLDDLAEFAQAYVASLNAKDPGTPDHAHL